jgi:hypothetical protein
VIVDGDGDGDGDDSATKLGRHSNDAGNELDPASVSLVVEQRKHTKTVQNRSIRLTATLRPAASAMFKGTERLALRSWSAR